jgi:hypothetical protein
MVKHIEGESKCRLLKPLHNSVEANITRESGGVEIPKRLLVPWLNAENQHCTFAERIAGNLLADAGDAHSSPRLKRLLKVA